DCTTAEQIVARLRSGVEGVLVGRGVLRNPWILKEAADLLAGRPVRPVSPGDRRAFLLDYIDLLLNERVPEAQSDDSGPIASENAGRASSHERWVVNKIRALGSWYTKGFDHGSHLRTAINGAGSV